MSVEVDVIKLGSQIPSGWRMMTLAEGKQYKQNLQRFIEEWSIIGFETGKLDGPGYGGNFSDTRGPECGEVAIINDAPKVQAVSQAESQPQIKTAAISQPQRKPNSLLKQATIQKQPTLKEVQADPVAQEYEPEEQNAYVEEKVQEKKVRPKPLKAKPHKKYKQVQITPASSGGYSGPLRGKQLTFQYEEIFKQYSKNPTPGAGAYEITIEPRRQLGIKFSRDRKFGGGGFLA